MSEEGDKKIIMKLKGESSNKLPPEIKSLVDELKQKHPDFTEDRLLSIAWYLVSNSDNAQDDEL